MNSRICRESTCPADIYVGNFMNWTPKLASTVRGRFEQAYPDVNYNDESISDVYKYGENYSKIIDYYNNLNDTEKEAITQAVRGNRGVSYANVYNTTNRKFNSKEVNAITEILSRVVLSYNATINKYINNGRLGISNLVEEAIRLHSDVLSPYIANVDQNTLERNKALSNYVYTRVLVEAINRNLIDLDEFFQQVYQISNQFIDDIIEDENTPESTVEALRKYKSYGASAFSTFLWMSKDAIHKQSGINFGKNIKAVDFGSIDEQQEMFEEEVIDGWQKKVDNKNPYDRASTNMRMFLAGIPRIATMNGVPTTVASRTSNQLLNYNNPNTLHGMLIRATRDCSSRADMMEALQNSPIATLQYVAEAIGGSEELQSTLWRECNKIRQSYHDFSIKKYATKASSVFKNLITGMFRKADSFYNYNSRAIKSHRRGAAESLIVRPTSDSNDTLIIDHENWNAFKDYVNEHIVIEHGVHQFKGDPAVPLEIGLAELVQTIANEYLGLNVNKSFINVLANEDAVAMKSFMQNVYNIANSRYEGTLSKSEKASDVIEGRNRQYFNRLFNLIEEVNDRSTMTARDKDTDSTYAKDTTPNDLGMLINDFRSFARKMKSEYTNKQEVLDSFKAYIADKFLGSSEYVETTYERQEVDGEVVDVPVMGQIYNDIINTLYNSTIEDFNKEDSFINEFIKSGERLLKVKDGYRTIAVDSMNESQNLLSFMLEFFAADNINDKLLQGGVANYSTFTMGDSSVIKTLRTKIYNYDQLKIQFANVALQEVARMDLENKARRNLRMKGNRDTIQEEEQNIDVDTICASGNKEANDTDNAVVTGSFVYLKALNKYKEELQDAYGLGIEQFKAKVTEILFEREGAELFNEFAEFFKEIDPMQGGKYGNILALKHIEVTDQYGAKTGQVKHEFMYFPQVDVESVYNITGTNEDIQFEVNAAPDNAMLMYYLNHKLALIQQFQIFKKNPDAYNTKDKTTGDMLLSSVMLQKRFKAENTPGTHPDITATWNGQLVSETGKEKVIYFKEFLKSLEDTDPALYKKMQETWGEGDSRLGKYKKTKSTDGQGFRTFKSYRDVMIMTDNWSVEKEAAYNRIQELRKELKEIIKKYEGIKSIDELPSDVEERWTKIIDEINNVAGTNFQPIKPHLSGAEAVNVGEGNEQGDILYVPVEHKYAEALLIPEQYFLVGNKILYYLGEYMEGNGIDMACSEECVKVGNWGTTELLYDTDDNGFYRNSEGEVVANRNESSKQLLSVDKETVNAKLSKAIVHELEYKDYEIQTEVPPHYDTDQLIGTQLRKLAFSTILKGGNYELFSRTLGKQIKAFKVAGETYELTDSDSLIKFYNALVSAKALNSFLGLADSVTDEESFSDILSALKSKDGQSTPSAIARYAIENGHFKIPLGEITQAYDNENYVMSLFKKRVNKQKVKGGSFVQVTDLGYDDLETHFDDKGNVTYHDCVETWDLSVNINGRQVPLKFSDWCRADGTLKINEKTGVSFLEEKYPGILDRIAYRIPSERMYSILNLKVKRFIPKINGGIISVPSHLVTAAGFDFDIDKLYYFKREFNINRELVDNSEEAQALVAEIWDDIYENNKIYSNSEDDQGRTYKELLKGVKKSKVNVFKKAMNEFYETHDKDAPQEEIDKFLKKRNLERPKAELYHYWEEARLPNTYQGVFDEYLESHPEVADRLEALQVKWQETLSLPDLDTDITEWNTSSLNNMFIDVIQQRIEDPNSFDARFTPGGFDPLMEASDMLKAIRYGGSEYEGNMGKLKEDSSTGRIKDYEPVYDPTNPLTSAIYNARNIVAGKVIGIMANHNINFAYSRIMEDFRLKVPITLFGREADNLIGNNTNQSADPELMLAMLLASSVDAVKAPVLNYLNINTYTANVSALLARTGFSGFEIGLFLNQPVIREVCDYMSAGGRSNISAACKAIANQRGIKEFKAKMQNISEQEMFDNMYNEKAGTQVRVLETFAYLCRQAQALSDFISQTKYTASNSVDNTLGSLVANRLEIEDANSDTQSNIAEHFTINLGIDGETQLSPILNSYFRGKESKMDAIRNKEEYFKFLMSTPFAFEQVAHDVMGAYVEALSKYFPYNTDLYRGVYSMVNNLSLKGSMSSELINVINSNIPVFLLANEAGGRFNPNTEVWVKEDTGELSWSPQSSDGWHTTTAEDYFTVEFTKRITNFIEDLNNIKTKTKLFEAKYNRYDTLENKESAEAVALEEELIDLDNELNELEESFKETHSYLMGNMEISDIIDNELLENLDYDSEVITFRSKITGLVDTDIRNNLKLTNNSQFDANSKSDTSNGWELLFDKNPKLAVHLYMSNFFVRGFDVGFNVFNNVTPVKVLEALQVSENMSYLDWIDNLTLGNINTPSKFRINNFLKLLYRNNYDNYELVKSIYDTLNISSVGNTNIIADANNGSSVYIQSNGDGSVLQVTTKGRFEDTVFAVKEGVTHKTKSGEIVTSVIPAFTIDVNIAGNTTKALYVLKSPVDNTINNTQGIITYERVDLPTSNYTLSYSTDIIKGNTDEVTLLESQTKMQESFAERNNVNSMRANVNNESIIAPSNRYSNKVSRTNALNQLLNRNRGKSETLSSEATIELAKGEAAAKEERKC